MPSWGPDLVNKLILFYSILFYYHRMGVTPEIGTSRSGNLLLQALIEGKKSYFCLYFFQIFMSKKMFVDRLDNYKIDNLHIMTKERCKYNL